MTRASLFALALTVVPLAAMADDAKAPAAVAAPAGPPTPAPAIVEFGKLMVGNWKCDSKWNASPFGPAHAAKGTATIKWSPGQFWVFSEYKEAKSKTNPMPFDVLEHFGYDAAAKALTRTAFDNFGAMVMGSAPGWVDDKLVFTSESHNPDGTKNPEVFTFTKKSVKEVMFGISITTPDGKTVDLGGGTCKK